jgi:hypothetical protein
MPIGSLNDQEVPSMPEQTPLIGEVILDGAMCLQCMATKADTSIQSIRAKLEHIATSVIVHQTPEEHCRVCGVLGPVISIVISIDVGVVTNVLTGGAAMCAECIARKTGIPRVKIPSVIKRARKTSHVETPSVPCTVCRSSSRVYRLHDPGASDLRLVMVALWNKRLCTMCLWARTGVGPARIDEIFAALGRVAPVTRCTALCEECSVASDVIAVV